MIDPSTVVDQLLDVDYFIACEYDEARLDRVIAEALAAKKLLREKRAVHVYPKPGYRVWEFAGRAYLGKVRHGYCTGGVLIADNIENVVEHRRSESNGVTWEMTWNHGWPKMFERMRQRAA